MRSRLYRALMGAFLFLSIALAAEAAPKPRYVEGEIIVKFRRALGPSQMGAAARSGHAEAAIARQMVDPETGLGDERIALARFPRTTSVEAMIARLRRQADVEYVEPNYVVSLGDPKLGVRASNRSNLTRRVGVDASGHLLTRQIPASDVQALAATYPNDPAALDPMKGWGWLWVNADIVWPDTRSAEVAVVDTGVDAQHPELQGLVTNGFDFINNDAIANDDNGHGTHVAGIIAARNNNKTGIAGVSRSRIYAVKVLAADGTGTYFDVAQGIRKAANRPSVKVINVSLGGPTFSTTLRDAVEYAVNAKGKLLVAAAGNDNSGTALSYPAAHSLDYPERVLAVGATGLRVTGSQDDQEHFIEYCRADYSNYGDYVNITAPGTDIYSTQPWKKDFYNHRYYGADSDLTGYEFYSGTSRAAPHVAAVAARVFGQNLKMTNVQVARKLLLQGYSSLVGVAIDVDGDLIDEVAECWETGFTPLTPLGGPFLADVNAASALGRGRITGRLMDATTGLGLNGATASLLKSVGGSAGYGGLIETAGTSFFDIINVPWNDQTGSGPVATPYRLRVSKVGYTAGIVEDYAAGDAQKPGISLGFFDVEHPIRQVSIPPIGGNSVFVTDWGTWDSGSYATATELDQYLFLPVQAAPPGDQGCTVGYPFGPVTGDCGDPGFSGSLIAYPWARFMRDGGTTDGLGTETTSIRKLLKTSVAGGDYRLFITDYLDGTLFEAPDAFPVVRLWRSGFVRATVRFDPPSVTGTTTIPGACVSAGGATPCDWWNVGSLTSTGVFTRINALGDNGALPYSAGGGSTFVGVGPRSRPRPTRASTTAPSSAPSGR